MCSRITVNCAQSVLCIHAHTLFLLTGLQFDLKYINIVLRSLKCYFHIFLCSSLQLFSSQILLKLIHINKCNQTILKIY